MTAPDDFEDRMAQVRTDYATAALAPIVTDWADGYARGLAHAHETLRNGFGPTTQSIRIEGRQCVEYTIGTPAPVEVAPDPDPSDEQPPADPETVDG